MKIDTLSSFILIYFIAYICIIECYEEHFHRPKRGTKVIKVGKIVHIRRQKVKPLYKVKGLKQHLPHRQNLRPSHPANPSTQYGSSQWQQNQYSGMQDNRAYPSLTYDAAPVPMASNNYEQTSYDFQNPYDTYSAFQQNSQGYNALSDSYNIQPQAYESQISSYTSPTLNNMQCNNLVNNRNNIPRGSFNHFAPIYSTISSGYEMLSKDYGTPPLNCENTVSYGTPGALNSYGMPINQNDQQPQNSYHNHVYSTIRDEDVYKMDQDTRSQVRPRKMSRKKYKKRKMVRKMKKQRNRRHKT